MGIISIVDDDPAILREMVELLEQIDPKGTHMQASDGTLALTLARERRPEVDGAVLRPFRGSAGWGSGAF